MDPAQGKRKLIKRLLALLLLIAVTASTYGILYFTNADDLARRLLNPKAAICPNSNIFTEVFSTTTYRDGVTTAWWNNSNAPGYLQLPYIRRFYENIRHSIVYADNKVYTTYFNVPQGGGQPYSINLQIIDNTPQKQFYDDKRVSETPAGDQTQLYSSLGRDNSSGDLYFAWEDFRDPATAFDFYAVRTDANGSRLWANDVKVNLTSFPSNTSGSFKATDIEVDSNGDIYFAMVDNNSDNMYLQKLDKNGNHLWASDVVIGAQNDAYQEFSIKIGPSGNLYVVYGVASTDDQLRIRKYSPAGSMIWERFVATSLTGADRGEIGTSINSSETVYIAYARFGTGILYNTVQSDGTVGTETQIAPYFESTVNNGVNANVVFAADFQSVYIVTSNATDQTAAYRYDLSGNKLWGPVQLTTLDTAAYPNPTGTVDSSGNFYPYYRDTRGSLSGFLSLQKVTSAGSLVWNPDILVDRFAFFQTPKIGQSTTVATETWNIEQAILTADVIHNFKEDQYIQDFTDKTSIKWYLSNDNGATWEEVQLGVAHNFTSTGNQLKWKADPLETTDTIVTPRVDELSIEYGDCEASPPPEPPAAPPAEPPASSPDQPTGGPTPEFPDLPNTGPSTISWLMVISILPAGFVLRVFSQIGIRRLKREVYQKKLKLFRNWFNYRRKNPNKWFSAES